MTGDTGVRDSRRFPAFGRRSGSDHDGVVQTLTPSLALGGRGEGSES